MKNTTKNTLAELAEFLKEESKVPTGEEFKSRAIAAGGKDGWKRYLAKKNKMLVASRIVAELAKVSNISQIPMPYWNCQELEALRNCRAIAEEGGAE